MNATGNITASNITASTIRFSVLSGSNGGMTINCSDGTAGLNPQIYFIYGNGGGGDFTSISGSVQHQSFGFNSQAAFGGTANQQSGRTIYFYDRVSSAFYGGIAGNDKGFYWGTSGTAFSLRILPPATSTVPVTIKAVSGQTADILSVTDSSNTKLVSVSSGGNLGIGNIAAANKLHIDGGGATAIRVDNGNIDTTTASNLKSFYGWLPVSIAGTTRWIQLYT